jgi:hypothetical protein
MASALAAPVETNEVVMHDAPSWVTVSRVNKVVDKISRTLEWDIRKVSVSWYTDGAEFARAHGLKGSADGSSVLAVSKKPENRVLIGPRVTSENFDGTFGHELTHVIVYQKYKTAIPAWLEEGLANYVAKNATVDYRYLASRPFVDVKTLGHPFAGAAGPGPRYAYAASTALMEMLASHCNIHDLLQLSVGEKLEAYVGTFCGIDDVNAEFQKFVKRKAGGAGGSQRSNSGEK